MHKIIFGMRLRKLRMDDGMTSGELARYLGEDRMYVYYLENGYVEPELKTIAKLSERFGVTAGFLIGTEGKELTERQKLIQEFFSS